MKLLTRRSLFKCSVIRLFMLLYLIFFGVFISYVVSVIRYAQRQNIFNEYFFHSWTFEDLHFEYTYPVETLSYDDYPKLMDLQNVTFVPNISQPKKEGILFLIFVLSKPEHIEKRLAIRKTWAQKKKYLKVIFLLGLFEDIALKNKVLGENVIFGDVVQASFIDSVKNLTYKHMLAFKLAIYHFPQARYILKVDDDTFVNIEVLMDFLASELAPSVTGVFCTVRHKSLTDFCAETDWKTVLGEEAEKVHLNYCAGWAILYSPNVVFELYRVAQNASYFWMDDLYLTGVLLREIQCQFADLSDFVLRTRDMEKIFYGGEIMERFFFGPPEISSEKMLQLWDYVQRHYYYSRPILREQ